MKIYTQITALIIFIFLTAQSYAQQRPESAKVEAKPLSLEMAKKRQLTHYRNSLKVDSVKAVQVSKVMDDYKAGMKKVTEDKNQNQDERRAKIKALIEDKNKKLQSLLTPAQQVKLIPVTERAPQVGAKRDSIRTKPLNP